MKIKFTLAFIVFLLCCALLHSQDTIPVFPGGVPGARIWWAATTTGTPATVCFYDKLTGIKTTAPLVKPATAFLNFHPAFRFTLTDSLYLPLGMCNPNNASYFTVYQTTDTAENNVWNITKGAKTALVLTTKRVADVETYKYMNYTDLVPGNPKLSMYIQQNDSMAAANCSWLIGNKPANPSLPVASFRGLIPEFILFDHALNTSERTRVSSYLSLKYGITLTEPGATYCNSATEKIWDGLAYSNFHNNIAGLCRDDSSGLLQKIATSSNTPGLTTMITTDSLRNNSSLLWGENGLPLIKDKTTTAGLSLLQKKWMAVVHGTPAGIAAEVIIDTKKIDLALPAAPVFWLAIDRSGEADFSLPGTEYIQMTGLDAQGFAHFKNVVWDKDGSGKDAFAFIGAQDILLYTAVHPPSCHAAEQGSLQIKIISGYPPYQLSVTGKSGVPAIIIVTASDSLVTIPSISTGGYTLKVTDAAKHTYTDSLYVNNSDAPFPVGLTDRYTIPEQGFIVVDAALQMPTGLSYEWSGPGNFYSGTAHAVLTKPGSYTLKCSKEGCAGIKNIQVQAAEKNPFNSITLFPNPTTGLFSVKISLHKSDPVSIHVYEANGKLIKTKTDQGRANYLFRMELQEPGLYELVFHCGNFKTTRKLLVVK